MSKTIRGLVGEFITEKFDGTKANEICWWLEEQGYEAYKDRYEYDDDYGERHSYIIMTNGLYNVYIGWLNQNQGMKKYGSIFVINLNNNESLSIDDIFGY